MFLNKMGNRVCINFGVVHLLLSPSLDGKNRIKFFSNMSGDHSFYFLTSSEL